LADYLGIAHEVVNLRLTDYQSAFNRMISCFEQPVGDPASLPLIPTCGIAADRVDVLLDGTGADGLFSGSIPRHLRWAFDVGAKLPRALRRKAVVASDILTRLGVTSVADSFVFDDPEELLITWRGWQRKELEMLFGETVEFRDSAFYCSVRESWENGGQAIYDAVAVFPPDYCRLDSAAIWDLPIHFPYHDAQVEDFVRALPQHCRYSGAENKIALRGLYKKHYPERFWDVKKKYFNFPLQKFLAHDDYRIVRDHLAPERILGAGLVDLERVRPWLKRYLDGEHDLNFKVWSLLILHAWLEMRSPCTLRQ
jgi:asparagine synthetase B (glutamine-hydrolysing)